MGFYLSLVVVLPNKQIIRDLPLFEQSQNHDSYPKKEIIIWGAESIVYVGRVTRAEKLTEKRFSHIEWPSKERAGVVCTDKVFNKIFVEGQATLKLRSRFAPKFLINESDSNGYAPRIRPTFATVADGDQFVEPFYTSSGLFVPEQKDLIEHNRRIALPETKFSETIEEWDPIFQPPFLWENCSTLAAWFEEALHGSEMTTKKLHENPRSVLYVRLWKSQLEILGEMGCKAMIVFNDLSAVSIL